jgi:hypothetical protein
MKRRLTERDVTRIVGKVLNEQAQPNLTDCLKGISNPPQACKGTDAGLCIKEIGRLVYNSTPNIAAQYGDAIKCLSGKIKK